MGTVQTYHLENTPNKIIRLISVNEKRLRGHMQHLSSDLMEGRGTGTRGESMAVSYIENQLDMAGLKMIRQDVPLVGMKPWEDVPPIGYFSLDGSKRIDLTYKEDFIIIPEGPMQTISIVEDDIVMVGYGITAPEYDWDDYKGKDVDGKIVLCFVNEPSSKSDDSFFKGNELTYYGRWTYKIEEAKRRGAKGLILIHTHDTAGYPFTVLSNHKEQVMLADEADSSLEWRIWITENIARKLFNLNSINLDDKLRLANSRNFQPFQISAEFRLEISLETRNFVGTNVMGILRGSENPSECVMITTHHDHLGMDPALLGDKIFNGAEDNASGVSAMITLAEIMSQFPPPKRSICFLSLTAEEHGLFGAIYYTKNPLISLQNSIAVVNFDIMNLYGETKDIVALGSEYSELKYYFEQASKAEKIYVSKDANPSAGSFFRSDTFAFAKAGIPSINVWSGKDFRGKNSAYYQQMRQDYVDKRYHQPSDEYNESWSMIGLMQQMKVTLRVVYGIANSDTRPKWFKNVKMGF